jgi:2-polyprenyl-3-methyl-5-hydroxy-6-metoxy-1,4-benzoquinol methylase
MLTDFHCPICGGKELSALPRAAYYVGKPENLLLFRCNSCRTVSSPDLNQHYESNYYDSYDDFTPNTSAHAQRIALFRERVEFLAAQAGVGNILDIGCARGDFLDQAARCGFTTHGLEVSADAAEVAAQRGHRVVIASAEELPFKMSSFNAIHMNHVLEHVGAPIASLRAIKRILKPNGVVVIEIPNELGPLAIRLKLLAGRLGVPGTERMRYAPHITYFNMTTLKNALNLAELRIIRRRVFFSGTITVSFRTVPAMVARLYDRLSGNGNQIEVVVTPR